MHDSPAALEGQDRSLLLVTPPSSSGRCGVISVQTLHQVQALRAQGVKFVLITGARLSTFYMRLPFLPAADAYVCESGGRIFYPGDTVAGLPTACSLVEDQDWRSSLEYAVGPSEQDVLAPTARQVRGVSRCVVGS